MDTRSSRFSEVQIISMLAEQERGVPTGDVYHKRGVSSATFYKWKAKYGGLDVSDKRLKRLLANSMLDDVVLKDLLGKL
jgi:putative transposase